MSCGQTAAGSDRQHAWLADETHRDKPVDLLVSSAHARKEDADASTILRRVAYFEPTSKISRRKLQNLIDVGAPHASMRVHAGAAGAARADGLIE